MLLVCTLAVVVFIDPGLVDLSPDRAQVALWVAVGATLCLTAGLLFAATVVFVAGAAAIGRYLRRRRLDTDILAELPRSRLLKTQATVLFTAVTLTPIVLQRPWLPEQAIVLRSGETTVGYLLGDADGSLAIMRDADRAITFVDPGQVVARDICSALPAAGGLAGRDRAASIGTGRFSRVARATGGDGSP